LAFSPTRLVDGLARHELVAELIADRDQLWVEAAHLEKEGEPDNIPELWPVAAAVADQHMKEDQIAEAVSLKLDELPEFDAVVLSQDMALAIGIEDVTRRGGQIAQSMATGAKRAGWAVKLGRVPGVKSRGGVRQMQRQRRLGRRNTTDTRGQVGASFPSSRAGSSRRQEQGEAEGKALRCYTIEPKV
jgi:hypothetical protein